jgi:PAS domain S-box-containing protein
MLQAAQARYEPPDRAAQIRESCDFCQVQLIKRTGMAKQPIDDSRQPPKTPVAQQRFAERKEALGSDRNSPRPIDSPAGQTPVSPRANAINTTGVSVSDRLRFSDLTLKTLLAEYAPATVLINRKYDVLQFYGATASFLELPDGEPSLNLMALLRRGLRARVRAVVSQAWKVQQTTADPDAHVQRDGRYYACRLVARPVPPDNPDGLLLLSFEEGPELAPADTTAPAAFAAGEDRWRIEQLEYELKASREEQLYQLEELVSTNEELKLVNAEMMSLNTDLASVNEKLEIAREEQRMVNKDLNFVNAKLQGKVTELEISNADIVNLLESSDIATLFLDRALHIKLFNPAMAELMRLRRVDLDRPIADISSRVQSDRFMTDVQHVLDNETRMERVVTYDDNVAPRFFIRRMLPYRAHDHRVAGVVIKFVDITERYRQEKLLEQRVEERTAEVTHSREQLELVLQTADAAVWVMDKNWHRELVTVGMHELMFGALPSDREKSWDWWLERVHPDERESVVSSLEQALAGDGNRWKQDYRFCMAGDTYHWISDIAHISRDNAGVWQRITGAMININDRRMGAILAHVGDALIVFNKHGVLTEFNAVAEQMFGYAANEVIGKRVLQLVAESQRENFRNVALSDRPFRALKLAMRRQQLLAQRKDGTVFPVEVTISPAVALGMVVCVVHDHSEALDLQQKVSEIASWEQENIGRELHDNLGQRLTGLRMLAMHLRTQFPQSALPQMKMLEEIIEQLKDTATEVSRICHGLAPISVAPEGLADALAGLMERIGGSGKVQCHFRTEPGFAIDDSSVAHQLFRIAQEALNNALKYADARNISIELTRSGDQLNLRVEDDGAGFELDGPGKRRGLGLRIMRYRANTIGALLSIDSKPGEGTLINCTYPTSAFS